MQENPIHQMHAVKQSQQAAFIFQVDQVRQQLATLEASLQHVAAQWQKHLEEA